MKDYMGLTLRCSSLLFFLCLSIPVFPPGQCLLSHREEALEGELKSNRMKDRHKKKEFKPRGFSSILKRPTVLMAQSKGD